jgi:mycothiol S-conjugate amidase
MRTIMALHAHPDDESSKGAGTVARYSDEGVRTILVTATGGEAGDVLNPELDPAEILPRIAEVRREELALAAKIIGYDEVIMLGYRDSGMPDTDDNRNPAAFVNAPVEEVEERLVALVREHKPDVLLGYDDHERYPHPDHLLIHDLSFSVFESAADADRFPDAGPPHAVDRLYAPVFSARRLVALHEAALAAGMDSPYADRLEQLDLSRDNGKLMARIDCTTTMERGRNALKAHRSQVDPNGRWFALSTGAVVAAYPWEDFELMATRSPIEAEHGDLFAGL